MLDNLNIEPAIQIRKNASIKTKRCPLRRDEVLLIRKLGNGDGAAEGYRKKMDCRDCLSSLKRVLGEDLLSKKFKHKR